MKIFHITRDEKYVGYDESISFVIVAFTSEEVVQIAKESCGDEGQDKWKISNVKEIGIYTGEDKSSFILVNSFNAG